MRSKFCDTICWKRAPSVSWTRLSAVARVSANAKLVRSSVLDFDGDIVVMVGGAITFGA